MHRPTGKYQSMAFGTGYGSNSPLTCDEFGLTCHYGYKIKPKAHVMFVSYRK